MIACILASCAPSLYKSAQQVNLEEVKEILADKKTNVNAPDGRVAENLGDTPLMIAEKGHLEIVQALIAAKTEATKKQLARENDRNNIFMIN